MSPRSNEMTTFFEKLSMYKAFCKVFGHGWTVVGLVCPLKTKVVWPPKVCLKRYTREKVKKSDAFAWEVRTSMSPRSNENTTFFQKLHMYVACCMVLGHLKSIKKCVKYM